MNSAPALRVLTLCDSASSAPLVPTAGCIAFLRLCLEFSADGVLKTNTQLRPNPIPRALPQSRPESDVHVWVSRPAVPTFTSALRFHVHYAVFYGTLAARAQLWPLSPQLKCHVHGTCADSTSAPCNVTAIPLAASLLWHAHCAPQPRPRMSSSTYRHPVRP